MTALVIGYGSIGRRHAANLVKLDQRVVLLRHRQGAEPARGFPEYFRLDDALDAEAPDFAIVASPTSEHGRDAERLIERGVPFLLEKPPTLDLASTRSLRDRLAAVGFEKYDVAFNLRFYPPLRAIKEYLPKLGRVFSVRVSAGFYLPAWRPQVDYRQTTSADAKLGGGVHIELVHELEYVVWLLGLPRQVVGHVAKVSDLEISSADVCAAILLYDDGLTVELHLDYLSHKRLRGCQMIAERGTLEWTFTEGTVKLVGPAGEERELLTLGSAYDFNDTYLDELRNFMGVVSGSSPRVISMSHAVDVMALLDAIVRSSVTRQWVDVPREN